METSVRYAVEGLYVDRQKSNPSDPSDKWVRGWKTWMECSTIERVNAVLINGMKLMVKNEYSGFSDLRVIQITEKRVLVHHEFD